MNKLKLFTIILFAFFTSFSLYSQIPDSVNVKNNKLDSIYIGETEDIKGLDKVLHAEPLFIDLIRDLGARKGEQEWNVGLGITDSKDFDNYTTLIEYEFAPIDRLGLEVELPFSFYYPNEKGVIANDIPESRLDGLKLAAQYSFYVSEKNSTSMALGYIHEVELTSFAKYNKGELIKGHIYNPFLVAAKRWGGNFHSLIYTGPLIEQILGNRDFYTSWQVNSNFHYMIKGTRNFIGIELNKEFQKNDFDMTIRPQMRVGIKDNLMLGIVTGIPIKRENERFSTFFRIIYEPKHKPIQ